MKETHPGTGSDVETSLFPPVFRNDDTKDARAVHKGPHHDDGRVEGPGRDLLVRDDGHVGVDGDARNEDGRGQVARRYEPALRPASARADLDGVPRQPLDVEQERQRLLDVGQKQVEDQHEELVGRLVDRPPQPTLLGRLLGLGVGGVGGGGPVGRDHERRVRRPWRLDLGDGVRLLGRRWPVAPRYQLVREEREQAEAREEGDEPHGGHRGEAIAEHRRQRTDRVGRVIRIVVVWRLVHLRYSEVIGQVTRLRVDVMEANET